MNATSSRDALGWGARLLIALVLILALLQATGVSGFTGLPG